MQTAPTISFTGRCHVDLDSGWVHGDGDDRQLRAKELELLRYLVSASPRVVPRDELLEQVWGYSGQAQSRTVEATMRRLRKAVEVKPSDPISLITVHGRGYRYEPEGPVDLEGCVGRAHELSRLQTLLAADHKLITLTGPGGIGKTTLATALLAQHQPNRGLVDLSRCWDLSDILQTMAQTLGQSTEFSTVEDALAGLAYGLASTGPGLLVLDNGEQITEPLGRVVRTLLEHAPELCLLVTSRLPLGLETEHRFPLTALSAVDSLTLLSQHAALLRPGFLTETGETIRREIIDALGGLPLAIVLAAAHTNRISPQQMLTSLKRSSLVLEDTEQPQDHRHRSLSAALGWSWQLLPAPQRLTLCAAGVFAAPFGLEPLAEVSGIGLSITADALGALVDHALIQQETVRDHVLYRLPVAVRQYAQSLTNTVNPLAIPRHRAWCVNRAKPGLRAYLTMAQIRDLAQNHEETREALRNTAPGTDDWMTLVLATNALMRIRGPIEVRADRLGAAIQQLDKQHHTRQRAILLERHGDALLALGEMSRAGVVLKQAIQLARQTDQPVVESQALSRMGVVQVRRGEREAGLQSGRCGIALAETLSDPNYLPSAHSFFGVVSMETGKPAQALHHFEEATATAPNDDVGLLANVAAGMGNVHLVQHNHAEAQAAYEEALHLANVLGSPLRASRAAVMMGNLHHARGDWQKAAEAYEAGRVVYRRQGRRWEEGVAMTNKAVIDIHLDNLDLANENLLLALRIHTHLGARQSQAVTRINLGVLRCIQGDGPAAIQFMERAATTFEVLHPHSADITKLLLVIAHVGNGHPDQGRALLTNIPAETAESAGLFALARAALQLEDNPASAKQTLADVLASQSDADVALAATMLTAVGRRFWDG